MKYYETFLEGVKDILETSFGFPVQVGLETELTDWISTYSGEFDVFLAYSGFEKIGSLEEGFATIVHYLTLYIRRVKIENVGIPEKIQNIVYLAEKFAPVKFWVAHDVYQFEIESGSVEIVAGEVIFRIPLKVYKVG